MSEVKITFVYSDDGDWIGLYIDGKLLEQGHSIPESRIAKHIVESIPVENTTIESCWDWDADKNGGQLPEKLGDVKWQN